MDSWYVEVLLKNRASVKDSIYTNIDIISDSYEIDFENDDYNNLLLLEKEIKKQAESGRLDPLENKILFYIFQSKTIAEITRLLNVSRPTIVKTFEALCDRLAYVLGGVFTNEGYLDFLTKKHNLTETQIEKARNLMTSTQHFTTLEG